MYVCEQIFKLVLRPIYCLNINKVNKQTLGEKRKKMQQKKLLVEFFKTVNSSKLIFEIDYSCIFSDDIISKHILITFKASMIASFWQ